MSTYLINGKPINLSSAKEIAAGGEGKILENPQNKNEVVKLYFATRPAKFKSHLNELKVLPSASFVIPHDIVEDDKGKVAGFTMDYVNFNEYYLFNNLFNKAFCTSKSITGDIKIEILEDMKSCIETLHKSDIHIGDLNQYNIYFSLKTRKVLFVDVDSYQTKSQPHSGVLIEDIRDYTTNVIDSISDSWAFSILSFWSLTYVHPFRWVQPGNSLTLEQKIKSNQSYLNNIAGVKIPKVYEAPTGNLLDQFKMIFGGRRFILDFNNAVIQTSAVVKALVASQKMNIRELYDNVYDVYAAMDQFTVRTTDAWHLIESKTKGFTRTLQEFKGRSYEAIYPGNKSFLIREFDSIKTADTTTTQKFVQPMFYFSEGYLSVLDYGEDKQYNYNIDQQLGGVVTYNVTSMYAKSVLYNTAPIMNFGKAKYLNIPFASSYAMHNLEDKDVKAASYSNGFVGLEYIYKNEVKYTINKANKPQLLFFDQLPHFASDGNILFVPEDGEIILYDSAMILIARLDASMCTKSSRLYFTKAGLLLLENNILYLCNSK